MQESSHSSNYSEEDPYQSTQNTKYSTKPNKQAYSPLNSTASKEQRSIARLKFILKISVCLVLILGVILGYVLFTSNTQSVVDNIQYPNKQKKSKSQTHRLKVDRLTEKPQKTQINKKQYIPKHRSIKMEGMTLDQALQIPRTDEEIKSWSMRQKHREQNELQKDKFPSYGSNQQTFSSKLHIGRSSSNSGEQKEFTSVQKSDDREDGTQESQVSSVDDRTKNMAHQVDDNLPSTSTKQKQEEQSQEFSSKQLFDPIMKVRNQISKKFDSKFEDLIFIKQGTQITEDQYYSAKQTMLLTNYFNPKTKRVEILKQAPKPTSQPYVSMGENEILHKMNSVMRKEKQQFQDKYKISKYNEIPFCIIIPSYKNVDKYFRNINSIFQQQYDHFHVIYIDDASGDGTGEAIQSYIDKYQIPKQKIKLIINKVNQKALFNIDYAARNLCQSGQIMMIIDGDDYLIGRQVFKVMNAQYQSKNLLGLYTNHIRVHQPIYQKVGTSMRYPQSVLKKRSFRHYSIFPVSHLRSFYVDLFWKIKQRDLKNYKGQYFTAANDFAIMMPILEMAASRFQYLPELTYIYDAGTGYNNFQTKSETQQKNFKLTKRRHKYPRAYNQLDFELVVKQKLRSQGNPPSYLKKHQLTEQLSNQI